jgi:hypothetical protein
MCYLKVKSVFNLSPKVKETAGRPSMHTWQKRFSTFKTVFSAGRAGQPRAEAGRFDDRGDQPPATPAKRPTAFVLVKISTGIGGATTAPAIFSSQSIFHIKNLSRAGGRVHAGGSGWFCCNARPAICNARPATMNHQH